MTITNIKFNCGCGFKTNSLVEAEKHAGDSKHTLAVNGEVRHIDDKGGKTDVS